MVSRSFVKRKIKNQPFRIPEQESQLGAFEKGTSKEGNNEKIRKGPVINVADTLILVSRAINGENQWYSRSPRMTL